MIDSAPFVAYPKQVELLHTMLDGETRIIGFGGGSRATKTWGCLAALITLCRDYPGSRWAVVRKDLQRVRDTVLPSFEKLRAKTGGFVGPVGDTRELPFAAECRNGSAILFRGENIDKDRELSRFHGYEVNGFLNEEADELSPRTLEKEKERAGAWIIPGAARQPPRFILNTFNPCASWPRKVFYQPWRNGTIAPPYAFIPSTAADNPSISAEQWESWQEMSDAEYRRFIEGDWETIQGAYYDTLNPDLHCIPRTDLPAEIPSYWRRWASYDWGYAHWSVMGDWVTDPEGTHYLLDALWLRKMQDDELAHAYAGWLSPGAKALIYAGHDCWAKVMARGGTGRSTADVFQEHGLLLERADIDPVNGGRTVNRLLKVHEGRAGVYFVQTPGTLRVVDQLAEILPAEHDVRRPQKVDADPNGEGGDDGCLRGDTEVVTDRGYVKLEDLVGLSGMCLTPYGWRRYHSVRPTRRNAVCLTVETDAGAVAGTPDHRVLTPTGWRELGELRVGDEWCIVGPNDHQRDSTGVSRSAVLADEGRVLSSAREVAVAGGLRSERWTDSAPTSYSPPRREHGEQPSIEPRSALAYVAYVPALDASACGSQCEAAGRGRPARRGVASFGGRSGVASKERGERDGCAQPPDQELRVLRQGVSDDSIAGALLPPEPQDAVLPPRGPRSVATVLAVRAVAHANTYDMEVDAAHCFVVRGGLVVHNSDMVRYGLSAWPLLVTEPDVSWQRSVHEDRHPGFHRTRKGVQRLPRRDRVTSDARAERIRTIRFTGADGAPSQTEID